MRIKNKRSNVLWLMSDQHHADCMSFHSHPNVKTPNMDWIAKHGICFDNAFANNPVCAPSRISFATGQYVHTHKMQGNDNLDYNKLNAFYLPTLFRRYGYQTAHIGKEHTVHSWAKEGYEYIRHTDFCDADLHDVKSNHYFKYLMDLGLQDYYGEGDAKPNPEGYCDGSEPAYLPYEHSIEKFTGDETIKFLDARDTYRPFFIHMSFQRPHSPVEPAKEFFHMYNPDDIILPASIKDYYENRFAGKPEFMQNILSRANHNAFPDKVDLRRWLASYYALISCIDMEIGKVLSKLKDMGELDNTIIIYTSDHGDFAGEHGLVNKGVGIYDSIQRIPFLLRWPEGPENIRCEEIMESVDLYPTLCTLCNIPIPEGRDGVSLIRIAKDGESGKEASFCETGKALAVRTKDYRLVFYSGNEMGELYDHKTDPAELNNLWNNQDYLDIKLKLIEKLLQVTMQYAAETDNISVKKAANKYRYTPVKLIHKHGHYWSSLKRTYEEKPGWPTENTDAYKEDEKKNYPGREQAPETGKQG